MIFYFFYEVLHHEEDEKKEAIWVEWVLQFWTVLLMIKSLCNLTRHLFFSLSKFRSYSYIEVL